MQFVLKSRMGTAARKWDSRFCIQIPDERSADSGPKAECSSHLRDVLERSGELIENLRGDLLAEIGDESKKKRGRRRFASLSVLRR